jgi:hypothetical protein
VSFGNGTSGIAFSWHGGKGSHWGLTAAERLAAMIVLDWPAPSDISQIQDSICK